MFSGLGFSTDLFMMKILWWQCNQETTKDWDTYQVFDESPCLNNNAHAAQYYWLIGTPHHCSMNISVRSRLGWRKRYLINCVHCHGIWFTFLTTQINDMKKQIMIKFGNNLSGFIVQEPIFSQSSSYIRCIEWMHFIILFSHDELTSLRWP